jgi:hypothetical protein
MAQKFVIVGDVYILGGTARLKITVSNDGLPVDGINPTVTIVRDSDNRAANFVLNQFAPTTPITISGSNFRTGMTAIGLGTYYYDFDPEDFGSTLEEVYTVIYRYDTAPNQFIEENEFTFTNSLAGKLSTGFGLLPRYLNVRINTPTRISYLAMPGQTDVKISIYNPFNTLLVAGATMAELGNTGVYSFLFTGTVDGDYVVIGSEATNGSKDAYLLTIGGDSDRLKRIESLLLSLNLKAPSVGPCER